MGFLGNLLSAGGSILGSILGGNSQKNAAQSAADEQLALQNNQLQYQQQQDAAARSAIAQMLPFAQGAAQAATQTKGQIQPLQAGQGAVFGGQQVNAQGSQPDYSSLLAPTNHAQMAGGQVQQALPGLGQANGMRTQMPQHAPGQLASAMNMGQTRGTL